MLQIIPHFLQETSARGSIVHPVVRRECYMHSLTRHQFFPSVRRHALYGSDGKNSGLRRVDDCREGVDVEHTEIAYRKGSAIVVLPTTSTSVGLLDVALFLLPDLLSRFSVGVMYD